MLNVLILDQLEHELRRIETIKTLLEAATDSMGSGCIEAIDQAVRAKRGLEYRKVERGVVRPSADLGAIAADACHRRAHESRSRGVLARMLARRPLVELGREDARRQEGEILRLLG